MTQPTRPVGVQQPPRPEIEPEFESTGERPNQLLRLAAVEQFVAEYTDDKGVKTRSLIAMIGGVPHIVRGGVEFAATGVHQMDPLLGAQVRQRIAARKAKDGGAPAAPPADAEVDVTGDDT